MMMAMMMMLMMILEWETGEHEKREDTKKKMDGLIDEVRRSITDHGLTDEDIT